MARQQIIAWSALALLNSICILVLVPWPEGGLQVRSVAQAYDLFHLISLGLVSALLVWTWERFGPADSRAAAVAHWGLALLLAFVFVEEDLLGLARKIGSERGSDPALLALLCALALSAPLASLAGRACAARTGLRLLAVIAVSGALVANHLLLVGGYPGLHLWTLWLAALLLAGIVPPLSLALRRKTRTGLVLMLVACCGLSIVRLPGNAVLIEMYRSPGTAVLPFVVRLHPGATEGDEAVVEDDAWFADRSQLPALPLREPALLGDEAVLILITIDAMRADMIDSEWSGEMPTLHKLRDESVAFRMARSTGSQTVYTLATLFSGKHFSQLRWSRKNKKSRSADLWPWDDPTPRLGTLLAERGVSVVSFASAWWLWSNMGIVGPVSEESKIRSKKKTAYGFPLAADVMAPALERVRTHSGGPLMIFMHFMDPHAPYNLGGRAKTAKGRYAKEIGLVDDQIARLIEVLREAGRWDQTTLIISSDHGEAFGEHSTKEHATTLYEELLRVPLIIRTPSALPRAVDEPVSTVDIGATILELFGVSVPGYFMGQSLVPFLRGESPQLERPIVAEGRLKQALITREGIKAIRDRRRGILEAYDLREDPEESMNIAGLARGREALERLSAFFGAHTLRDGDYVVPYRK